ncbi:hypothetical protein [Halovivax gelatinilyticus]|uniref:hypothetical protein n=1 Tax=Halovivax gelatinilyticus TaxID=2961597 RepID=UPI0020CA3233|nr:hypothetical protein [Halovivax gelatinilyticus]
MEFLPPAFGRRHADRLREIARAVDQGRAIVRSVGFAPSGSPDEPAPRNESERS